MITLEGAYYLFVLAFVFTGAVLREINLMLVLAGMMLGPLLYNAFMARRMTQRFTVRRRLPATAIAGEPLTVELVASSPSLCRGFASKIPSSGGTGIAAIGGAASDGFGRH